MGSDVGRIVRAAGVAKDHEGISFFLVRTHKDGTTVAACKFDRKGLIGNFNAGGALGTTSMSGVGTTLRVCGKRVGIAAAPAHIQKLNINSSRQSPN